MKKFFLFLFLLFLSLILQFILKGWTDKVTLDFFFILTIFWSYIREWREGVLAGFCCGLTKDIFFFPLIGVNAFSLLLIGLLASEVKIRIYQQNIVFFTLMVGILFLINSLVLSIWLFLFYQFPFVYTTVTSLYPSFFFTLILCAIIYLIGERLTGRIYPTTLGT